MRSSFFLRLQACRERDLGWRPGGPVSLLRPPHQGVQILLPSLLEKVPRGQGAARVMAWVGHWKPLGQGLQAAHRGCEE